MSENNRRSVNKRGRKAEDLAPEKKQHIRHLMLYEFHRGSTATEAMINITAIHGQVLSVRRCQIWFERFRSGDHNLKDKPKTGRPSTFENRVLRELVNENPKQTTRAMGAILKAHHSTVVRHLHKMNMVNKIGKWVPHQLTDTNLMQRSVACLELSIKQRNDPFLERIVTGDEKWVLYVNVRREGQWLSVGQTPEATPKAGLHPAKVMLSVWWDHRGIIHFELLEKNRTITANVYCQQLDRLMCALVSKRPALVNRKGVILLHDNARPHTALATQKKIKEFGWEVIDHPPYSPDIAPSDYHLFRSLQNYLSGKNFDSRLAIEMAIDSFFGSKSEDFFRSGIMALPNRWQRVIENNGHYIID